MVKVGDRIKILGLAPDADGSKDTYGVPVEAVTPDMIRRFAESIIGEQP